MNSVEQNVSENYSSILPIDKDSGWNIAINDFITGIFKKRQLWMYLGLAEMRRRYKRTIIGPFWTTISLGLFIGCMGFLLSSAWHTNSKDFLPYFCAGYICWMLIQSVLSEGCTTFTAPGSFVKQISLPYSMYACLLTWRNVIVLFHHLVIMALVLLYCGAPLTFNYLLFIPGLAVVFFTCVWVATLLGMLCSRYRDIQQIITSMLQLAMFMTPIMWKPDQLGHKGVIVADLNPLFHFVSIIRLPLIGEAPSLINWVATLTISAIGFYATLLLMSKKYKRVVFWL